MQMSQNDIAMRITLNLISLRVTKKSIFNGSLTIIVNSKYLGKFLRFADSQGPG